MDDSTVAGQAEEPSGLPVGELYEARLGNVTLQFRIDSPDAISIPDPMLPGADSIEMMSSELRPGLFVFSWHQADGASVVHMDDFEQGVIHIHLTNRDGSVWRAKGTLRRMASRSFA
jgi:hypothetical protein